MEKAINRKKGRVSRTTDDEFAMDGFLRERVMMPSERHRYFSKAAASEGAAGVSSRFDGSLPRT